MIETIDGGLFQRMVIHAAASINLEKQSIQILTPPKAPEYNPS